jgi:hypothetical protein
MTATQAEPAVDVGRGVDPSTDRSRGAASAVFPSNECDESRR